MANEQIDRATRKLPDRPKRWGIDIALFLCGGVVLAVLGTLAWLNRAFDDCGISFVSDRPDLTHGGFEEWAKGHASDFVPVEKARDLKIAITQGCMAPSPETLIAQFVLASPDLKAYLRRKTLLPDSLGTVVARERAHGLNYRDGVYNQLSWWPPKPSPTLKTYAARDASGVNYHCFVEQKTGVVTVIASASRGR